MSIKISTEEAKDFVCKHYALKGIPNDPDDWVLTKKYRNFKGITCRDFSNTKNRVRAIVIAEPIPGDINFQLKVIENENFEYYLKLMTDLPLFYYVPVICNDGLVFIFESANHFEQQKRLSPYPEQHDLLLRKKLLTIFKEEDIFAINNNLRFSFPNIEMDEAVRRLERNKIAFNSKLFSLLDDRLYQPIIPDIKTASYLFPQDEKLDQDGAIEVIFSMISQKEDFSDEDYARIKMLLKKVREEEFPTVKKIALGFKRKPDKTLLSLFDVETNRKKSQKIVQDIWLEKK
jgi:hypothetical protein